MKVTTNKFNVMDVVRFGGKYCQVMDIIAKRWDDKWCYDLHDCFGDEEFCDIPENKIRDLTEKQKIEYEYKVMV